MTTKSENQSKVKAVGYVRVSSPGQAKEGESLATQRQQITEFSKQKGWELTHIYADEGISGATVEGRPKFKEMIEDAKQGKFEVEVLEVLNELKDKDVAVYSVKENFQLNGNDMQAKVMRTMLGLFSEIERDLISARTKEGLLAAKAKGTKLGRPKGTGKSKLDQYRVEIESMLKTGVPKTLISRKYRMSQVALHNWLKKHGLNEIEPEL